MSEEFPEYEILCPTGFTYEEGGLVYLWGEAKWRSAVLNERRGRVENTVRVVQRKVHSLFWGLPSNDTWWNLSPKEKIKRELGRWDCINGFTHWQGQELIFERLLSD